MISLRLTEEQLQARVARVGKMSVRKVEKLKMDAPVKDVDRAERRRQNRYNLMPKTSEHTAQAAVIRWWASAHAFYRLPEWVLFAVPNAAKRGVKLAAMMKAEGLRAGVLDLCLDVPAGQYHALRIEMKIKPNSVSADQQKVLDYYAEANYLATVCWSSDEAIAAVKRYLARTL